MSRCAIDVATLLLKKDNMQSAIANTCNNQPSAYSVAK